jgi:hypothetical protein
MVTSKFMKMNFLGWKDSNFIMKSISNIDNFRKLLSLCKIWAKRMN